MAVQFKFRSAVEFNSVGVEGPFISVGDLKRKIAEHKNLSKCKDFDLLITDAQTGEEYYDESILIPTNTSVIIKRVPVARPKSAVVLPDVESVIKASSSKNTDKDDVLKSPLSPNADIDGFGDFGVDVYADSEPCLPETCMDESDMVGIVNKEDLDRDRQRQSQGPSSGSQMFEAGDSGRALARGHYDKHSPINADPTYDNKIAKFPEQLVNAMKSDEMALPKKLEPILPAVPNSELPSELRCSLCKGIFRGAVMIPCCQFSFCHECIRQVLVEKGKCPQCNSTKFKIDELLPNIALRQAIERFLESQVTISTAEDCGAKHAPDGESGIQAKAAASQALSHRQGLSEVRKSILDNGEGVTVYKALQSSSHKYEGITMEFQASKGRKRKKSFPLSATGDGVANFMASGKLKKGGRCCYVCGSPEHLARDCPDNSGTYLQHGMFHAGGPLYPGNIPAYGPNTYWHGAPMPHVRPFPSMYGPTPPPLPFETSIMPVAPYAIPPYMPSMYSGVPIHCGFMRMGSVGPSLVAPSERPLSREEFMQLQDHERRRRFMQEQQDRERIQEKANSMEGDSRVHCLESQKHWYDQQKISDDEHHNPYGTHELDRDSVRNYSDESIHQKSRSGKLMRKHSQEKYIDSNACRRQDSVSDDSDHQKGKSVRYTQKYSWEKYVDSNACQGQDTVSNESDCQKRKKRLHGRSQEKYADSYACRRKESMCEDEGDFSYDKRGNSLHSERWHRYSKSPKYSGRNRSKFHLEDSIERSNSELEGDEPWETCHTVHGDLAYLKSSKQSVSKRSSDRKIIYRKSGSPCNSHLSRYRSKVDASEDLKWTSYNKNDTKKHGYSEYAGEDDANSLCRYDSAEEENIERKVQHETHRSNHRKKWRHSTGEYDLYFSSEDSKRRKKSRNDQRNSLDKTRDTETNVIDESELHTSRHRKHKSKSHSKSTTSVLAPIEETRWQMDAGFDTDNEDVYYMYHTRDKHDHSHKKKEN